MDNAAFHKSSKTRELIESAGCKLLYLPPYSPELNPIEKTWANIKRSIRNFVAVLSRLFPGPSYWRGSPALVTVPSPFQKGKPITAIRFTGLDRLDYELANT